VVEEEYWRQWSRVTWLTKGDANTAFFHAYANGRRRKCAITRLVTDSGTLVEPHALQAHIYEFYRALMGSTGEPPCFTFPPPSGMLRIRCRKGRITAS
jgi:hypothetical protein